MSDNRVKAVDNNELCITIDGVVHGKPHAKILSVVNLVTLLRAHNNALSPPKNTHKRKKGWVHNKSTTKRHRLLCVYRLSDKYQ